MFLTVITLMLTPNWIVQRQQLPKTKDLESNQVVPVAHFHRYPPLSTLAKHLPEMILIRLQMATIIQVD